LQSENNILITIDVEDWFQVENFKSRIPFSTWNSYKLRVEKNTYRILELLDSFKSQGKPVDLKRKNNKKVLPSQSHPKATFFVLGWLAERLPQLIRDIDASGHEVASHGYDHRLCGSYETGELKNDLTRSKMLLEDTIGKRIVGYRAPSFSINNNILKLIKACGYIYDSSFNSFSMHGRYGTIDLPEDAKKGVAFKISEGFNELPISNIQLGKFILPWGGGGYFRLIPFLFYKAGVLSILKKERAFVFYMHPWEIDPNQPTVHGISPTYRFRHYINLKKTYTKLAKLHKYFSNCHFITCSQYLGGLHGNGNK